ncbi:MAG TPA: flagellar motor protein MotD [Candidatus Competibacteraceae bacterium]|nr:flagellar motor protein MotD [Candidatus Competibacteraceae bacterium]MCP5133985.1 flagellar motor protein MotD [Gammaproteobacteria bacterium]HPF59090.1 flagellar motor protein MotD [Candidatus Competibacteraceae bacterium]HRY19608.1 flagellar motor protein MotD [Candidatus Competibacteraceae bacterium]
MAKIHVTLNHACKALFSTEDATMSRKKHAEGHENHERWLVSYADFITLLFAFFVVMYAVSSVNEGKYRVLSESMSVAFKTVDAHSAKPILVADMVGVQASQSFGAPSAMGRSMAPDLRPMPTMAIQRSPRSIVTLARGDNTANKANTTNAESSTDSNLAKIVAKLQAYLSELIKADMINLRSNTLWVEVEIKNNILFDSGSAIVNPDAQEPLAKIAEVLREVPNRIQVEGFTDNRPINTPVYPSNWELSAARAANVVNLLMREGVRPERMSAVGYGEFQPIADNGTEQGRMQNRRVVLVIMGNTEPRYPVQVNEANVTLPLKGGSTSQLVEAQSIMVTAAHKKPES